MKLILHPGMIEQLKACGYPVPPHVLALRVTSRVTSQFVLLPQPPKEKKCAVNC